MLPLVIVTIFFKIASIKHPPQCICSLKASEYSHSDPAFCFLGAPGTIEIPVLRHGSDLSSLTSVWCATRPSDPPSASPGVDYIPSSKKVEFKPGKTEEVRAATFGNRTDTGVGGASSP